MQSILITEWESGTINSSGVEVDSSGYIRSIMIKINSSVNMAIMSYDINGNELQNSIYYYTQDKEYISCTTAFNNGTYSNTPEKAYYARVVLKLNSTSYGLYSCLLYLDVSAYTLPLEYEVYTQRQLRVNEKTEGYVYTYEANFNTEDGFEDNYTYVTQLSTTKQTMLSEYKNTDYSINCQGDTVYSSADIPSVLTTYTDVDFTKTDGTSISAYFQYTYNESNSNYTVKLIIDSSTYSLSNVQSQDYNFYLTYTYVINSGDECYLDTVKLVLRYGEELQNKTYTL